VCVCERESVCVWDCVCVCVCERERERERERESVCVCDFISELVLAADKVLIVGDFNIHVDNEKDALGSACIDILNSIGVRQHVSGPTHYRNHTLDLILSHLVLCKLHIAKTVNSTSCYK